MGNRGSQLSQSRHARDVRELRLRLVQRFIGPLALGDIHDAHQHAVKLGGLPRERNGKQYG